MSKNKAARLLLCVAMAFCCAVPCAVAQDLSQSEAELNFEQAQYDRIIKNAQEMEQVEEESECEPALQAYTDSTESAVSQEQSIITQDTTIEVTLSSELSDAESNFNTLQTALFRSDGVHTLTVRIASKGTYPLGSGNAAALKLRSETVLDLNGAMLLRTGNMGNLIQVCNQKGEQAATGYSLAKNITIENGALDGEGGTDKACNLVNIGHSEGVTLSNLKLSNCRGGHLLELTGCQNCLVKNCSFTGFTDMKDELGEAIQLDICREGSTGAWNGIYCGGIGNDGTVCKNITVTGCTFLDYPSGVGNHHAVKGSHSTNITITNNRFLNTGDLLAPAIWSYGFENCVISGNEITGEYEAGIRVSSGSVTIEKNTIGSAKHPVDYSAVYFTLANSYQSYSDQKRIEEYVTSATVASNHIYSEVPSGATIVVLGHSTVNSIKSNTVIVEDNPALFVLDNSTVKTVEKNQLSTKNEAVKISGSSTVTKLSGNTLTTEDLAVCVTGGGTLTTLTGGKTTASKGTAVYVSGKKSKIAAISSAELKGKNYALQVKSKGSVTTLSKVNLNSSAGRGIYVTGSGSSVATLKNCTISAKLEALKVTSKAKVTATTNCKLTSSADNAIYVASTGTSLERVESNTLTAKKSAGLYIAKGTLNRFTSNTVTAGGCGVKLSDGAKLVNAKSNQITVSSGYGFYVTESNSQLNTVQSNTVKSQKYAVWVKNGGTLDTLDENKLNAASSRAIVVEGKNSLLDDASVNTVTAKTEGVYVSSGGKLNTLEENTITVSAGSGILVTGSSSKLSKAIDNTVKAKKYSVRVQKSGTLTTLQHNKLTSTGGNAVSVDCENKAVDKIQSNTITAGSGRGLSLYGAEIGSITSNTINNTKDYAVILADGAKVTGNISSNKIKNCKSYSIYLSGEGTKAANIAGNIVEKGKESAIYLSSTSQVNYITSNSIKSCEGHGIYIEEQAFAGQVGKNTIQSCTGYAVYCLNSAIGNLIGSNTISGNKKGSVYVAPIVPVEPATIPTIPSGTTATTATKTVKKH